MFALIFVNVLLQINYYIYQESSDNILAAHILLKPVIFHLGQIYN